MKCLLSLIAAASVTTTVLAFPPLPASADARVRLNDHIRGLHADTQDDQLKAVQGIRQLGPWGRPAIPDLVAVLPETSPHVVAAIADALAVHGRAAKAALPALREIVRRPGIDPWSLTAVGRAMAALGDAGNPDMIRAMLAADGDGRKSGVPIGGLIQMYPVPMIPAVAARLTDPELHIRARAAVNLYRAIHRVEPTKSSAFAALSTASRGKVVATMRDALGDDQAIVRNWIIGALVEADPSTVSEVMPALTTLFRRRQEQGPCVEAVARTGSAGAKIAIGYLDDPDPHVRDQLISLLARSGPEANPAFAAGIRHPNPRVREGVLRACHGRGEPLRRAVAGRLKDDDPAVRLSAAIALANLGASKATAAVPVLTEAAFSADSQDRIRALEALQSLGVHAASAIPDLLRRVRHGDVPTRFAASLVLVVADRSTWPTYVPVFAEIVRIGDNDQRQAAARHLGSTGPNARTALPALRKLFEDEDPRTRIIAAQAVVAIAPTDADDAISTMALGLQATNAGGRALRAHRRFALQALQRVGPAAKAAVPVVLELLRTDEDLAVQAAVTAVSLDPAGSKEALDLFRVHLRPDAADPDEEWLDGLAQLGKNAKPLAIELAVALRGKTHYQRAAAADVLRTLGPDAKAALPALREMTKSKDSDAARAAIRAIEGKP